MAVPKIRFPGFTDAWEQRKFSEVFYSIPNNTLSRSELSTDEGTVKNIHYGDVLINFDAYIDVQNAVLPRIVNDAKATKAAKSTLKDGDVVIADTAEDETVGKCAEIGNLVNDVVVSGLHTIPSRPKFKFGKGYLGFYMNSSAYHDQLRPLIQGIKVSSISKSALAKTELKYPKNMAEQEKIGSFFLMIDNTITLHQRKLEGMKLLKKSLLQKMFPKSGESVPEVRFPGFTDAWEQRKFAELANIRRGLTYKPNDVTDSGIRVLRSSNINEDSFIENDDDVFVKESAVNISSVKDGDILITSANGSNRLVGKHAIIFKAGQAVHGGFMLIASAYGNPYFLNASMSSSWYTNFVNMYVAGGNGAIGNLKKSDLENQVIRVPSEAEQLRIGQFFQSLDQTITLHQRKVEILHKLKKSLLRQMFV